MVAWITMIGAIVAALTGLFNIWRLFRDGRDSIHVRWGCHRPMATNATALYVVNTGKHAVELSDYGFILDDGTLFSVIWYGETEALNDRADNEAYMVGSSTITPRDMFSVGITFHEKTIGVYARTITQHFNRVDMIGSRSNPLILSKWLKAKYLFKY